jgi:hypothetical protein
VTEGIALEGIRETGVVRAQVGEGYAQAGMADQGGGGGGVGGGSESAAVLPLLLAPLDVIVDGRADAIGVPEAVGSEELVVRRAQLQEGVAVVVARHYNIIYGLCG